MREFIVEADGGSRGNPGPAGYGAVVIDAATGQTLAERAEYLGVVTNNVAEYRGLLAGLRAAHELDPAASVHVRMDSKLVVEQMSGRWKIKHPDMKPLALQASGIFPPDRVTYEWIPREQNKHADRLANEAMDAGARGEPWEPSASTAELDAEVSGAAADAVVSTAGPDAVVSTAGPDAAASRGAASTSPAGRAASATSASSAGRAASATPASSAERTASTTPASSAERAASVAPASTSTPASSPAPASTCAPTPTPTPTTPQDSAAAKAEADVRAARVVATPGWGAPDMGAPATFVLLRHGETPLTPQKRFSGSGGSNDPSLSEIGREQAERVAEALARRGTIQAIVASPLARTRETAAAVAARLGLEVATDEGLRETDFGAWEGLTFGEVRERYPDDLNAWLADPEARPTGGGESFAETAARIAATRDKLVATYAGRTVLLVSHVTPIKTFVRLALGAPAESLFRMELSAASLSAVAYYADGNASVRLFNDTSHLR
ncbi:bifunctional RNase H/acid phosphatase [Streptomyces sp. TRM68416]|uniref:bifunctional RNase H/acid phosphatase n=1 Tax=Streptomyces sp. TRM68416 TaxID=2758412 RepID=UPI001661EFF5|nr:bifunctional RNase H/acid phosphatase [Streptomyces sp. TRM68416]MBD0837290.1 bifunctional RNase H/acid phosphatase [Streptomyces sp. TRM68416]